MSTRSRRARSEMPGGGAAAPSLPDHRWRLADGTVLYAPYGELVRDGDGRLRCHLCGRWFRALGAHLRVHRYTAQTYREVFGLCTSVALVAEDVSARISDRQAAAYHGSPQVRERLAPGQDMARSGQLRARARTALAAPAPPQRAALRAAALETGRRSRAHAREADLEARLAALGYPGGVAALGQYLRVAYSAGASLEQLRAATGLSRARLRAALLATGVVLRPSGVNTTTGHRSRAHTADAQAAARVGTHDLTAWIRERHAQGWSLSRLARELGRSTHWVRWRLEPAH